MPHAFHRRPTSSSYTAEALSRRERLVWSAVAVHVMALLYLVVTSVSSPSTVRLHPMGSQVDIPAFHGGSPNGAVYGSCFQSDDGYAMCNPFVSVGVLVVPDPLPSPPYVLLSHRAGEDVGILQQYVPAGATAESTLRNLIKERIGLDTASLPKGQGPSLLGMYSKPPPLEREPSSHRRRHIARAIYALRILSTSPEKSYRDLVKVPLLTNSDRDSLLTKVSGADRAVLSDYMSSVAAQTSWRDATSPRRSAHTEEIGPDVARSMC